MDAVVDMVHPCSI